MGSMIGAGIFGAGLSGIGALLVWAFGFTENVRQVPVILGALGLLYGVHEFGLIRLPHPQSPWQVPEKWRAEFSPNWSAFLYGMGLGPGVLVSIPFATFYLVLAWVLFSGNVVLGTLCFVIYGIGRVTPVVLMFYFCRENEEVFQISHTLSLWQPVARIFSGFALSVSGALLICIGLITFG